MSPACPDEIEGTRDPRRSLHLCTFLHRVKIQICVKNSHHRDIVRKNTKEYEGDKYQNREDK